MYFFASHIVFSSAHYLYLFQMKSVHLSFASRDGQFHISWLITSPNMLIHCCRRCLIISY